MPLIGDVLTSKDKDTGLIKEGNYYLKVNGLKDGETVVLRNGDIIDLRTAEVYFNGLVEAGMMTEAQRTERLGKTPAFVKLKASINKTKIVTSNVIAKSTF